MEAGGHLVFVAAAYAAAALTVVALVIRAVLDGRAQRRALAELDGTGEFGRRYAGSSRDAGE